MTMKISRLPPASARYLGYGKAAILLNSDIAKIGIGIAYLSDFIVRPKIILLIISQTSLSSSSAW